MINNAMAKFADIKKGLYDTSYEISGKQPSYQNTTEEPRQAISLIDLDDGPISSSNGSNSPVTAAPTVSSSDNVMNDLSDLFGASASISSPAPQQQWQQQQQLQQSTTSNDIFDLLGQSSTAPPSYTSMNSNSNSFGIASPSLHNISTPPPQQQQPRQQQSPSPPLFNSDDNSSKQETGK